MRVSASMLDFFDEKHWWNKPIPRSDKPLEWCPLHNYYFTPEDGQTCLRCEAAGKVKSKA
jgi:hypothetical protein